MGAFVNNGCVKTVLTLKNNVVFWAAVGRTSPWTNENNPPIEEITVQDIVEIQGFKKIDFISACKEDVNGEIIFKDKKYSIVSDVNAYSYGARWVYVRAILLYENFPLCTYRQIGIYADTVPSAGHETKNILLPSQVDSNGALMIYNNIPPVIRDANSKNIIEAVIEIQGQVIQ